MLEATIVILKLGTIDRSEPIVQHPEDASGMSSEI